MKSRRCIRCEQPKPETEFARYRYTTRQGKASVRFDSRCHECNAARRSARHERDRAIENARSATYHAAHRERLVAAMAKYRAVHRDAMRAAANRWRTEHRDRLLLGRIVSEQRRRAQGYGRTTAAAREVIVTALELARFGDKFLDAYTGELIDRPTIDHIVPLVAGGEHASDNVCVTSLSNNSSKHDTPLLLWLLRRRAA